MATLCRRMLFRVGHLYGGARMAIVKRNLHLSSTWFGQLVQFKLTDIGEGIAEVQVKEWHVKPGDRVSEFDNLCEVQSDKASVTITSRYEGVIRKLYYAVDDIAPVGQPLIDIELDADEGAGTESAEIVETETKAQEVEPPAAAQEETSISSWPAHKKALATPAVRRIAMEHKINIADVKGSGKEGRVLKEDILRHIDGERGGVEPELVSGQPSPFKAILKEDSVVPIRGYTRIMFKTMTVANQIPHFGYCDEICVDRLVDLRKQLSQLPGAQSVKMSYMPLFVKAASMALIQFPLLNSSIDDSQENLIYKASHNICVAIDTPGGLIVPNIKNCEQRNVWEIAGELNRLQEAATKMQVDTADLAGGTFTLSNIGTIGGTYTHPVIFPPQVVIGALGKIQVYPRFNSEGQVFPSRTVKVSWAADHRVIDGATVARFSNLWKSYLENPALMIAELR